MSEAGADGPINGDKSPYDNIAFFIQPDPNKPAFPVGNITWADHMLNAGTSCFTIPPIG